MLNRFCNKEPKTFICWVGRFVALAIATGCILLGCTSRFPTAASSTLSEDSQDVGEAVDAEKQKLIETRITRFSGAAIHEADNKQPLFLKKTLDSIVGSTEQNEMLEVLESTKSALPGIGRPSEGFSSAIGAEIYLNRRKSESLTSEKDLQAQAPSDQLRDLKKKWLLLVSFAGPQGLFQTARYLKEYFLMRGKDQKEKRPTSELSSQLVHGALEQIGFWSRPARAAKSSEEEHLSAGEKIFQRNRALLLLELISKIEGKDSGKFQKLNQFLSSLVDTQTDGRLLWVRTHVIVNPSEQTDWFFALGPFSLLSYSFAHISDLTNTSFTFTTVTYNFLFGVHSWTQSETSALLNKWCTQPARKEPLYESTCDDVFALQKKLNIQSLGVFSEKGLATEFEVKGYSPVYLHKEKIEKSNLNSAIYRDLQQHVSHFSL